MSRYYRIEINGSQYVFTNQVDGKLNPGALEVHLDLPASSYATPFGSASVKVCGIPLTPQGGFPGVTQASDLNGKSISVFGGMQKGLPLATLAAGQSGLLISGVILQAFGNWMGPNQTLDFVITSDGGATQAAPANLVLNWKKGTKLADAINQTLTAAYPSLKVNVNISSSLVLTSDEAHACSTIQQFAEYVNNLSQSIISGGTYSGVQIFSNKGAINVFDNSAPANNTTSVAFTDLVGQATWLDAFTIQFNTQMRADLTIGSTVKLPSLVGAQAITTPQSNSFVRNKTAFDGSWNINAIRHVGNSRGADAMDWVSTFQAVSLQAPQIDQSSSQSAS